MEQQLQTRDEILINLKEHLRLARTNEKVRQHIGTWPLTLEIGLRYLPIWRSIWYTQEQIKKFVYVHHQDMAFDIGEWVYWKIKPYCQQSLAKNRCEKLSLKFFEPNCTRFKEFWGVAYLLDLTATVKIHSMFHVSQLNKVVGEKPYGPSRHINDEQLDGVGIGVKQGWSGALEWIWEGLGISDYFEESAKIWSHMGILCLLYNPIFGFSPWGQDDSSSWGYC